MRLESLSADPFLLEYAQGAMTRFTKPIQKLIAPVVETPTQHGHFKKYGPGEPTLKLPSVRRALTSYAVQVQLEMMNGTYSEAASAIDIPVDFTLGEEDVKWHIADALALLAEIESQVTEIETINIAIQTVGAGEPTVWSPEIDPVKSIDAVILQLILASKSDGVAIAFGTDAWDLFKNHPLVVERCKGSPSFETHPALFHAGAEFAACYSFHDAAAEGLPEDIQFMFPADAVLVLARSALPTRRDPSFMKTFRLVSDKVKPRVNPRADGRGLLVSCDWAQDIRACNLSGARRLNVSAA